MPGYAFYGAENGNFFIVGVGGGNNGNPTGDATVTAGGVSLIAPGTCSGRQRRREPLLHRLRHGPARLDHAVYRHGQLRR